MAIRR